MPKPTQSLLNKADFTGRDPGELLCALPRKFKKMIGANCHLR